MARLIDKQSLFRSNRHGTREFDQWIAVSLTDTPTWPVKAIPLAHHTTQHTIETCLDAAHEQKMERAPYVKGK